MKFIGRALVFIFLCAALVSLAAAQVPQFSPFSADAQITSTGDQGTSQMPAKIFVGSGHMRVNLSAKDHQLATIRDFSSRTVAVLLVEQETYIEHPIGMLAGHGPIGNTDDLRPFDPQNPCFASPEVSCKKIGVESVSGRTCQHWQITSKDGNVSNVWIDEKLHFPIKMTSDYGSVLLTNIKEGEPAASLFQIPAKFHKVNPAAAKPPTASGPAQN